MLKKKSQKIEKGTHINFLEVSQSPSSPDKPEQTDNNTANAGKERKIKVEIKKKLKILFGENWDLSELQSKK